MFNWVSGKNPPEKKLPMRVQGWVKVSFGIGLGLGSDGLNGLIDNSKYQPIRILHNTATI